MQRIKAEMIRSKTSNLKTDKHSDVTSTELKFAKLGVALQHLNLDMQKELTFVAHLKKAARKNELEYKEESDPHYRRRSRKKQSNSPSPTTQSRLNRGSVQSRSVFKNI